jgi:hypothetical protein
VANVFTAVPGHRPPPPTGAAKLVLPIADLFVKSLVSEPATGTLATAWVTPATLALSAAAVIAALVVLTALVIGHWPALIVVLGALLCLGFAGGAGSVVAVGTGQRRRSKESTR